MLASTYLTVLQRPSQPLERVCARLRDWGCRITQCASSAELLQALATVRTDLVLIDADVEDSMHLVARLKAEPETRYLPTVATTMDDPAAVAAYALALGADDIFALPIEDTELYARIRALSRLGMLEIELRRRESVLAAFGVRAGHEARGVPAIDRTGILLIGPAGGDQIQVLTALGGAATAAYAETADSAIERLRRDNLDVALVTTGHDHHELQRLCATVRSDADLFDLPVLLVARGHHFADRAQPFAWGVSDVLFQPFHPEVLRLRVQAWVRQQRLRRQLRGGLGSLAPTNDRLTRLYGHGFLHAYVGHLIEQSARAGGTLALVSLAVAKMSQINQLYGYAAGDRVLATLGGVLARSSRAEDLPARLEGDRFCLVLNNATALDARAAAERFGVLLSHTPIALPGGRYIQVALETGVAELAEGDDAATLIDRAFARKQLFTLPCAS